MFRQWCKESNGQSHIGIARKHMRSAWENSGLLIGRRKNYDCDFARHLQDGNFKGYVLTLLSTYIISAKEGGFYRPWETSMVFSFRNSSSEVTMGRTDSLLFESCP